VRVQPSGILFQCRIVGSLEASKESTDRNGCLSKWTGFRNELDPNKRRAFTKNEMGRQRKRRLKTFPKRCRACHTCVLACSMVHEQGHSSLEMGRLSIHRDLINNKVGMTTCRNCPDPRCMDDCPPGAISQNPEGLVIIDEEVCTACGNCQRNCPFDAIIHIRERETYQKCDLCIGRETGPLCVEVCPVNAIVLAGGNRRRP
jgi:electron transport protein HydN